jgi:hypothetical protein
MNVLCKNLEVDYLAANCWGRHRCSKSHSEEEGEDQFDLHDDSVKLIA